MSADSIDYSGLLANQEMTRPMQHQAALLLRRLGLNKAHRWPPHGLADCLGVGHVVLLPLDVGLYIGRRHQPHAVSERFELARPMMRRRTGFDTNQARRKLLEQRQNVAPLQLPTDDHFAFRVDAVNLKNRLGDVETDCRSRLYDLLLRIVGASTAPTSMALACRWRSRPQHQKQTSLRLCSTSSFWQLATWNLR